MVLKDYENRVHKTDKHGKLIERKVISQKVRCLACHLSLPVSLFLPQEFVKVWAPKLGLTEDGCTSCLRRWRLKGLDFFDSKKRGALSAGSGRRTPHTAVEGRLLIWLRTQRKKRPESHHL